MIFSLDIANFDKDFNALVSRKESFTLVQTGYTARIKQDRGHKKTTCLYTEKKEGISPRIIKSYNIFVLKYINKVRSLAKNFELEKEISSYSDIGWCSCLANLPHDLYLYCIDVKSAYFYSAVELGLFSKEYIKEYNESFSNEVGYEKLYKPSRLVILGSLATKRRTRIYKKGICKSDSGYKTYDEKMRNVYVEICKGVDNLMIELNTIQGTVGYYWDCVFATSEEASIRVSEVLKEKGFEFTIEKKKVRTYYYPNGGGCLVTDPDNPDPKKVKKYQFNYRKVITK